MGIIYQKKSKLSERSQRRYPLSKYDDWSGGVFGHACQQRKKCCDICMGFNTHYGDNYLRYNGLM